ncbi:hypothetical protein HQ312_09080 [Rhodococcus sp. BP-316]|uniref:hypothetical protein n=1 Tax=unclassified Rhodococcus (in: high G+C Gram-positive bacteria) TaxID=192944 RepID=UPI001C9A8D03|nr:MULTISPECIES: hypothetical protein [unclassified Rhodococcus (in: high G+C Gram-positive bacteria)]MBY6681207.1 hypothetical protein [Rhodococcus sp. BP-316]MDQ1201063.1 hypothetical protein [Rhodococcus sp. SORGH_AS_0303]
MSAPSALPFSPVRAHTQGHYVDRHFGCTIIATTPSSRPDLWTRFLKGAHRSYTHHDVLPALEHDTIRDGSTTALFFCALDTSGAMLAGARLQGPYTDARDTHADIEWRHHPIGRMVLRQMVDERLGRGVVELKTGWVESTAARDRHLADVIGYAGPLGCSLLGARYALVTAADHVVRMWQSTGAVTAESVEPAVYPDDRYRTRALWWDLESYRDRADPRHVRRIDDAAAQLAHSWAATAVPDRSTRSPTR